MATLQFPIGISQCLLSMGIAGMEPQWKFSIESSRVTLNLTWDHVTTGTLSPGPPPGMKPLQHPKPQYYRESNMYSNNTSHKYVAPRFSRNNVAHRSDYDRQWRNNSHTPKDNNIVEKVDTEYEAILTKGSTDLAPDHDNIISDHMVSTANDVISHKTGSESDTVPVYDTILNSVMCDFISDTNHISSLNSDKSETDSENDMSYTDYEQCNDSNTDSDGENTAITPFSLNTLYETNNESEHNSCDGNITLTCPTPSHTLSDDKIESSTLQHVDDSICKILTSNNNGISFSDNDPHHQSAYVVNTDNKDTANTGEQKVVEGEIFNEKEQSNVPILLSSQEGEINADDHSTSEGDKCNDKNDQHDEPRFLSRQETCETINAWVDDISKFLFMDDNFRRLINSGWQSSSIPNRGLDTDNDKLALNALIGYVVRFSNGAILQSQTRTCKSLKGLMNCVYRYHNIPLSQYMTPSSD